MNECDLIIKYIKGNYTEDEFIQELKLNIDFIDFSSFKSFYVLGQGKYKLIDIAFYNRHCMIFEFLLEKYHKFNTSFLNNGYCMNGYEYKAPIIYLLNGSINAGLYDFVEICLKFISDENINNGYGESLLHSAIYNGGNNEDIIELLKMHGCFFKKYTCD